MNERRQQWLDEKPGGSWGDELRFQEGDLIIFNFVASGNDGDMFIKMYRAHEFDVAMRNGRPGKAYRYCTTQNGESEECPYCVQGHTVLKERMSMWMWVDSILHASMPPEKQYPQVNFQGRVYFREEVGAYRVWNTSAWRDSPWNDILNIAELYQGLHAFTAQMAVVGRELQRRYKVYAMPNSTGLPPELYERAKAELKPIPQMLKDQMASPVTTAPAQPSQQQTQSSFSNVQAWSPSGSSVPQWQPGAQVASPAPVAVSALEQEEISVVPEADPRRPLKELF